MEAIYTTQDDVLLDICDGNSLDCALEQYEDVRVWIILNVLDLLFSANTDAASFAVSELSRLDQKFEFIPK